MIHYKRKAFTLIELLVVISIIALLLSILMPALSKAKQSAMLVTCSANTKQIAMINVLYQTDNKGYVPTMINRYSAFSSLKIPAKHLYMSMAFWDFLQGTTQLPSNLSRDRFIGQQSPEFMEYCKKYLPKYFVCPFSRNKKVGNLADPSQFKGTDITINGRSFENYFYEGYNENYQPWSVSWGKDGKGFPDQYRVSVFGRDEGYPKYGNLVWHAMHRLGKGPHPAYLFTAPNIMLKDQPISWNKQDLQYIKTGSLAEAMTFFCEKGQFLSVGAASNYAIYNYKSHRKGDSGGTNVGFGDGHVGWVKGTQIGWP